MIRAILVLCIISLPWQVHAQEVGNYKVNPGDVLEVFIWNEEALSSQALVRPDGFLSLPLAGEIKAGGQTPAQIRAAIEQSLSNYLNDTPVVTVSVAQLNGNIVYVLGKVNRPGAYPVVTWVDVTQALAWAGGLNTFADEGDIQILRRMPDGSQQAFQFDYSDVKNGEKLGRNIILQSGDVVIVP
jgi:polysaccharide export outer membrane protein